MRISDWSSDVCSSDLFGGQFLGREHLAFTEAQWADDLAGEHPVLDLICRTFDVGDAKIARGRFDLVDRRRRDDRDAVALRLMRLDDRARLGVNLEIGRASCRERVCQYV